MVPMATRYWNRCREYELKEKGNLIFYGKTIYLEEYTH